MNDDFSTVGACSYCDTQVAQVAEIAPPPDEQGRTRQMCTVCYELGAAEDPALMMRPVRLDHLSRAVRFVVGELRRRR